MFGDVWFVEEKGGMVSSLEWFVDIRNGRVRDRLYFFIMVFRMGKSLVTVGYG